MQVALKSIVGLIFTVVALQALAQPDQTPLRGPGGQLEAAGALASVFQLTLSTLEGCGRSANLKGRAQKLQTEYVARNKPIFMEAMGRLPSLARRAGGDAEVQRVQRELEQGLGQIENIGRGVADASAQRPKECSPFFGRVERKELDLKQSNAAHLRKLGL